jgi:hypothetical protein
MSNNVATNKCKKEKVTTMQKDEMGPSNLAILGTQVQENIYKVEK